MFFPEPKTLKLHHSVTPIPPGTSPIDVLNGWNDLNYLNDFFRLCPWQTKIT